MWEQLETEKIFRSSSGSYIIDSDIEQILENSINISASSSEDFTDEKKLFSENSKEELEGTKKSKRLSKALVLSKQQKADRKNKAEKKERKFIRQPTYTGDESDDSYDETDESQEEDNQEEKTPRRLSLLITESGPPPPPMDENQRVKRLRNLSSAKQDLHVLLTHSQYSNVDSDLVIQVLRSSLHRETIKVKYFRNQSQILVAKFKSERKEVIALEKQVSTAKMELLVTSTFAFSFSRPPFPLFTPIFLFF